MSSNLLGELVANNGTYFSTIGYTYEGNIDQVIVRGTGIDRIFLFITVNGQFVDVTNQYVSSSVLPNGLRITPKGDSIFTKVFCDGTGTGVGLELVLA